MSIVRCIKLTKTYQQEKIATHALNGIDLEINRGELVSLSGASGSGKTTLLNMIGGLDSISSGQLFFDDSAIHSMDAAQLADLRLNKIGFVFQAYNLIPVLSAVENVAFIMQLQGVSKEECMQKSLAMLDKVGLKGMENRRPAELSGGQQQRVAVARAIVNHPALVLADEPTANLDSNNSLELLQLMKDLNESLGITFIISSHDPKVIDYTNRQVVLKDGQIESDSGAA